MKESDRSLARPCNAVQVEMEGLTGNIMFDDSGKRKEFSLDVVEMTMHSETVKVSQRQASHQISLP
jgi:hypothetical protein